MAKYIVTRSSNWRGSEKPIDEAVPVMVHWYFEITSRASEIYRNRMREKIDIISEDDGGFRGFAKEASAAWVCEITDIHAFVEKYGKIILNKPSNKEGYWEIEIYDDYRE